MAEAGKAGFVAAWLRSKGLHWAADLLDQNSEVSK
jgi:hypothetical protein